MLIDPSVQFHANNHKFSNIEIPMFDQGYPKSTIKDSIILRRGSWVGAASIILVGVKVSENSVVGAGGVVSKSVPPNTLFCGKSWKNRKNTSF